jgi:hypothetical protein
MKEIWFNLRIAIGMRLINWAVDVLPDYKFKIKLCAFLVKELEESIERDF